MMDASHSRPYAGRRPTAILLLVVALSTLLNGSALAAGADPSPANAGSTGGAASAAGQDSVAAEQLALEGNACMACHGPQGQGNDAGGVPRLAGLPAPYLEKQLQDFTTASRPSEVMTAIANSLTPTQRQAMARYYAALPPPSPTAASAAATQRQRGRELVEVGDNRLQVQACGNCHGPGGTGLAGTATPWLAGQQSGYLRNSLTAWRSGKRNNDPSQQMPGIAKRLRPEDVEALLAYLGVAP